MGHGQVSYQAILEKPVRNHCQAGSILFILKVIYLLEVGLALLAFFFDYPT